MPHRRRFSSLAVLGTALVACSNATAPTAPSATVAVRTQSVTATTVVAGSATWLQFSFPVRIENTGSVPLTFDRCASTVEAQVGATWSAAYKPVCALNDPSAGPATIAPGQSLEFSMAVEAALEGPGGPQWLAGPTATEFRFTAGLLAPGVSGPIPHVPSNSFTLVIGR